MKFIGMKKNVQLIFFSIQLLIRFRFLIGLIRMDKFIKKKEGLLINEVDLYRSWIDRA